MKTETLSALSSSLSTHLCVPATFLSGTPSDHTGLGLRSLSLQSHQRNFLLQFLTQRPTMCREWETLDHPLLNGMFLNQSPTSPPSRLREGVYVEEKAERLLEPEVMEEVSRETVFCTQQGWCMWELAETVTTHTGPAQDLHRFKPEWEEEVDMSFHS